MTTGRFAIALGSNRRTRYGGPRATIAAALDRLGDVVAASAVMASDPVGPSRRRFANAVAIIESDEAPVDLLHRLKSLEREFGRRAGRRWGARALDCDIILWSRGAWAGRGIVIPHPAYRERAFVTGPLMSIAPDWRDPLTGLTVRQLHHRRKRG